MDNPDPDPADAIPIPPREAQRRSWRREAAAGQLVAHCRHDWLVWAYVADDDMLHLEARCSVCLTETHGAAPSRISRVGAHLPAWPLAPLCTEKQKDEPFP